ncbi:F-box/kelch-repeat protein [Sesamum alatum]|uniref:F-box/kelch-repeat protein n=1 Tax=Sesamum alatum TaxID=300844 RepID=A0AAE2C917_9LAMI|nr:F-box/kelch-repeat protein [Sesamum alatum]
MPGPFTVKRIKESDMCFSDSVQHDTPAAKSGSILFSKVADAKNCSILASKVADDWNSPILPGLPDDVSKHCLALVPRSNFPAMGAVSKRWRSFIKSKELITIRKLAGVLEEWLYVLTMDAEGKESHWEVLDCFGQKHHELLPMPGPLKAGFGVVVLNGKLLVIAGYSVVDGTGSVSTDVYQYDSCLNSWSKLASMNVARYDFACAEVNGKVYVVGGCGIDGGSLSCAEMYDPDNDKWTLIESLRRPRWGCFACGFEGKLYVMGGRSSFTIGNSRSVAWSGKTSVKLAIFNPAENSWKMVPVPVTGSSSIGFRFGILDGKLLLFPVQEDPGYHTLSYDPNASLAPNGRLLK